MEQAATSYSDYIMAAYAVTALLLLFISAQSGWRLFRSRARLARMRALP